MTRVATPVDAPRAARSPVRAEPQFRDLFDANLGLVWKVLRRHGVQERDLVFVYLGASAITADRAPTFTLSQPAMTRPSRLAVDAKGRLHVADEDGVVVFRDIAANPTYVTALRAGTAEPRDLTIVE